MNEHLKEILDGLEMDGGLRSRLTKIFDAQDPVIDINLKGREHGRPLEILKADLPALLAICKQMPTLKMLSIEGRDFDESSMDLIAESISQMSTLDMLYLKSDNLRNFGPAIHRGLMLHPTLQVVYWHGAQLDDTAAEAIAQVVAENSRINRLSIRSREITDIGIQRFVQLQAFNRLDQVAFSCKSLTPETCKLLGLTIATNTTLKGMMIETNKIEGEGLEFLLDGMKLNSYLTDIAIFDDSLRGDSLAEVESEVSAIVERNKRGEQFGATVQKIAAQVAAQMHRELGLHTDAYDDKVFEIISAQRRSLVEREAVLRKEILAGGAAGAAGGGATPSWVSRE